MSEYDEAGGFKIGDWFYCESQYKNEEIGPYTVRRIYEGGSRDLCLSGSTPGREDSHAVVQLISKCRPATPDEIKVAERRATLVKAIREIEQVIKEQPFGTVSHYLLEIDVNSD